jgi:protoporphyrinogen oxidase
MILRALEGRSVGIVGGGLLGLGIAHRLAEAGVPVTVYEADRRLGGLAGTTTIGGVEVDRYYHAVTLTDDRVIGLAEKVGLDVRWRPLGVGFYHDGRRCSMSTPRELLAFPGLRLDDKARLAAFVLRCRRETDQARLDAEPIEPWVRRTAGDRLWERLWKPLLESKFDGRYHDLPATYLWSRTRRTAGTRDRKGREVMGWIEGGYQTLVDRLGDRICALGGEVHTATPVRSIPSAGGRPCGVVLDSGFRAHDQVVTTMLRPAAERLLSDDLAAQLPPDENRYLGIVCVVARVRHSVSPYYALQITDRRVPITSVVETTHVVDQDYAEGHLVYIPRYVDPASPELERPSDQITAEYLAHARTIFPAFREEDVIATQVARTPAAEPIRPAGAPDAVAFPLPGLAMPSIALVHPDISHGQAVLGAAEKVADRLRSSTSGQATLAAA